MATTIEIVDTIVDVKIENAKDKGQGWLREQDRIQQHPDNSNVFNG